MARVTFINDHMFLAISTTAALMLSAEMASTLVWTAAGWGTHRPLADAESRAGKAKRNREEQLERLLEQLDEEDIVELEMLLSDREQTSFSRD